MIDLLTTHLLPAEKHTIRLAGKHYHWWRDTEGGQLDLYPGYAPGDHGGCEASMDGPAFRVCVLHRGHTTRHRHRPTLDAPAVEWGDPPRIGVRVNPDGTVELEPGSHDQLAAAWGR